MGDTPTSNRPKPNTSAAKPNRSGPTADRISSQNKSSVAPVMRLPPIKAEPPDVSDENEPPTIGDSDDTNKAQEDDIPLSELAKKLHGTFTTKEHILEKKVETCKYQCRMCKEQLPSCRALTVHHQTKHGIIYCDVCGKAFNNPRSLTKHLYQHKQNKQHVCSKCKEDFPFASQLTTHKLTHRKKPNQACMYPKCGKRFKSKSDLNCHAASHTKPWLKCTDCLNYRTKDKRNFESHRLTHSKIESIFVKNAVKGSLLIPKNGGILAKTTVVNLEISSEIKQDTMCGNINGMCFKLLRIFVKIACTMCGNENRNTSNVLRVETLRFVKL